MRLRIPDDGLVKPKHVGAFIAYFNLNFNILKRIGCALVGLIKEKIATSRVFAPKILIIRTELNHF
jgi:hypothetical protein